MDRIFSFIKVTPDSMIASSRIATYVSELLNLPIISDESIAEYSLDRLIIINGAYAFAGSDLLAALGAAIEQADQIIWVQNDYTIIPPKDIGSATSPFRRAFTLRHEMGKKPTTYWTTCRDMCQRSGKSKTGHILSPTSTYVNWNCLTWDPSVTHIPMGLRLDADKMVYYGACRKDRIHLFDRYFAEPVVPTVVSCPNTKFESRYPSVDHWGKFENVYDSIAHYGLGLYLEDKRSSKEFHSPANRFYEMLSANLAMVFPPESARMMKEAGYDVTDFMAFDAKHVADYMEEREDHAANQRSRWAAKAGSERKCLEDVVLQAWEKVQ